MNRIEKARVSAMVLGTMAALTACTPSGDKGAAGNESASAAATTATTETGGSTAAGATAGTTSPMAGDSAMGNMNMPGGAMGDPAIMGTINTSNAAEIGTSELAQERAAKSEVKSFANDMIKAHQRMQKEGDQLGQRIKVTAQPAGQADQMQQMVAATLDTLKGLRAAQFDQKYMAFQVQSHQMTLDNLRRFEAQAQNAELKGMISKAIPEVQQHLERAQKIQAGLGGAAATGATKS